MNFLKNKKYDAKNLEHKQNENKNFFAALKDESMVYFNDGGTANKDSIRRSMQIMGRVNVRSLIFRMTYKDKNSPNFWA